MDYMSGAGPARMYACLVTPWDTSRCMARDWAISYATAKSHRVLENTETSQA